LTNSILAALAGLILLLLVWVSVLSLAFRRQTKARQKLLAAIKDDRDVADVIAKALDDIDSLRAGCDELVAVDREHRALLGEAVRHVGIVRYDAFPEVGGRLSFSAAFLNEAGDGVIISAITGRSDSRVYAKPVSGRKSTLTLSEDEEKAISEAYKGVKA